MRSDSPTRLGGPAKDDFVPLRFSTADLPACDRIAIFREVFGRQLIRVDIEPLPDQPLQAKATMRRLPELRVLAAESFGLRIARPPELLDDSDDVFCLYMELSGTCVASAAGRSVTVGAGDGVLLYGMEPTTTTHRDTRHVTVVVPRTALTSLVPNVEDAILREIPAGNEALRLLPPYLRLVREELALASPELRHAVVTHVHDLVALAVGANRDGAALAERRGLRAARLAAIKADILENLGRRDLSIAQVAARQGISPRHIRRLLRTEETTFSDFVLSQRLVTAYRRLGDPRSAERTITAVAFACGFSDLSYFNRAFRRHYGVTPSDVRAMVPRKDG